MNAITCLVGLLFDVRPLSKWMNISCMWDAEKVGQNECVSECEREHEKEVFDLMDFFCVYAWSVEMMKRWLFYIFCSRSKHSGQQCLSTELNSSLSAMCGGSHMHNAHVMHAVGWSSIKNFEKWFDAAPKMFTLEATNRKIKTVSIAASLKCNMKESGHKTASPYCTYDIHHHNDLQLEFSHLPGQLHSSRIIFNFSCVRFFSQPHPILLPIIQRVGSKLEKCFAWILNITRAWHIWIRNDCAEKFRINSIAFIANMCWSL